MLTYLAYGLAVLICAGLLFLGVRFIVAPRAAAAGYGVPAKENGDAAYLTVKGVRDSYFGIAGLLLAAFAGHFALGLFLLFAAYPAFADAVIVLRHGGAKATAYGVHALTGVVILADAVLLLTR